MVAIILTTFLVLSFFNFKLQIYNSAQASYVNFWYTCDFHIEPDPDAMSNECRHIYGNKAVQADVYNLYKSEAQLFYKFRNKLVECESNGKICTINVDDNGVAMPSLIGYDIDNRVRMYQESDMNRCYLESNNNIEFIKCIIEKRKDMIKALKKGCSNA
ncbi:uncharacterized protein [Eurosta solidaginis]|uniref:uncharacterized protein n=1 Tax=Eurosta solidaginis TaxID=178769 RepID=UPI0035307078